MTNKTVAQLVKSLNGKKGPWLEAITATREMVLSNLTMISQIPAETFHEEKRAGMLLDRYIASGIPEPTTDSVYNASGIIPGEGKRERRILIFAHMDQQSARSIDPDITITGDMIQGRGVAEDTLALATLLTLPDVINRIKIKLDSEIVLLATSRSHGRGDLGGIRHFMKQQRDSMDFAINLVGTPLATVDYFSLSRVRCDITCAIDQYPDSPWAKFTNTSAILAINEIINKLSSIPLPRQPKTLINIGMISGGERYSTISTNAEIGLEILSEDDKLMESTIDEIHDRCIDIGAKYDVRVNTDFFGRQRAAGLTYSHPLIKSAVNIINSLGYRPIMAYNNSELAIPLSYSVPAVCLGITTSESSSGGRRAVDIKPIPTGILQVIMLLYAIDRGYCDE